MSRAAQNDLPFKNVPLKIGSGTLADRKIAQDGTPFPEFGCELIGDDSCQRCANSGNEKSTRHLIPSDSRFTSFQTSI
jgi:hypothetical protein